MAKASFMNALTGGLPADLRLSLRRIADYFFNNLRVGVPDDATRSENFQAYFFSGTTPSTANTEFSIAHGLGATPYLLIPVLNVQNVNEQLVPLKVTRAADVNRVYLQSSSTSAAIRVLIEVP